MREPIQFYKQQLESLSKELLVLKRKLNVSSTIRLLIFFLIIVCMYFLWGNTMAIAIVLLIGVAIFLFLVSRHSQLQYKRDLIKAQVAINKRELKVINRDYYDLPDGKEYSDPEHYYSHDIDLFGRGSFFQYVNRTGLKEGSNALAKLFTSNDIQEITKKQRAIEILADLPEWRQRFTATAQLVETEMLAHLVVSWLHRYTSFLPKNAKIFSRIFSGISILTILLYVTGFIAGWWVFVVFGIGIIITGRYAKSIGALAAHTGKIQSTFTQYARLLKEIEEREFKSELLSEKRKTILHSGQASSFILQKFSRHLDAFDQRNNILIGAIANGFFLRDWAVVSNIDSWILTYRNNVEEWFETISFFDAYNSLGNYSYNHPEHQFPSILETSSGIETVGATHPLLDPKIAVRNNFKIGQKQFFIITGANMAGKSTFLRTVALQIVMGNMGLPICATKANYSPTKLITSMRTTDSLTDDESYFFSELKRLKYIVDEIKTERYFIILDEILKGTNSTDKAIGSRKFVDKLVASGATGIIATHDLSLCAAANDLDSVENYYFDARIEKDELVFDYTFKQGICQNMNASFLLKKMKIVE